MATETKRDTIFALSSGHGAAGISVIRVSGDQVIKIASDLTRKTEFKPRYAYFSDIIDPRTQNNDLIDQALIIFFQGPASSTGEDLIEFHCHGSPAVVSKIFDLLNSYENCRLAEAGEFTKRAVNNGKMSLDTAEGIGDLVHAQSESQRIQALAQMRGKTRDQVVQWRESLTHMMARLAADIDFAEDEDDVSSEIVESIKRPLAHLQKEIESQLANISGLAIRNGITFLFVGAPNAGKSSLLNALIGDETAIVTPIAGTTRDFVTDQLNLGDHIVTLKDTPGLRKSEEIIEQIGISRTLKELQQDDETIVPILLIAPDTDKLDGEFFNEIEDQIRLVVHTKSDLMEQRDLEISGDVLGISAETGQNLDLLKHKMREICDDYFQNAQNSIMTNSRHQSSLISTYDSLCSAEKQIQLGIYDTALIAEDLRLASRSLGNIIGDVDVEGLLDIVFSTFCIGK